MRSSAPSPAIEECVPQACRHTGRKFGAGCGARSRNTQIHNLVLYQLS